MGGTLGHCLCTGLAVVGGRMVAQKISVRTGKICLTEHIIPSMQCCLLTVKDHCRLNFHVYLHSYNHRWNRVSRLCFLSPLHQAGYRILKRGQTFWAQSVNTSSEVLYSKMDYTPLRPPFEWWRVRESKVLLFRPSYTALVFISVSFS